MMSRDARDDESLHRQARILVLLHAADKAGLSPISVLALHGFAYLANVLAPVWDMPALDGKVLKRSGGAFYPNLQSDIDRLVGMGMVRISEVSHVRGVDDRWRLEGRYCLNEQLASPALRFLFTFEDEQRMGSFLTELAYALSALGEAEFGGALGEDATFSDPDVSDDNVVDFSEWALRNPTARAISYFDRFMPSGTASTPGEKLHLYVRHLRKRLHDARR